MAGPKRKDGELDRRYKANRGQSNASNNNQYVKGANELIDKLMAVMDYIENDVPLVIGTEAVNHFKESFTNEGFTDTGLKKWQSRASKRTGNTANQAILTKSGELGDSIDFRIEGKTIVIYSDKKYAQIHNEGGIITVTDSMRKYFWSQFYLAKEAADKELMEQWKFLALSKEIRIPKRQFIGESETLNQRIAEKMERDLTNILT